MPATAPSAKRVRLTALLLAWVAVAGCAPKPWLVSRDFAGKKADIKRAVLLPPLITVYEERASGRLIPHEEWTRQAQEALGQALAQEAGRAGLELVPADGEEPEARELLDLFAVADYSIERHAYPASPEYFPAKTKEFEYSLGDPKTFLGSHGADAVWLVAGANLLPTTGAQIMDVVGVVLAVLGAAGGGSGATHVLPKLRLSAALVDGSGEIRFYTVLTGPDARLSVAGSGQEGSGGSTADVRDPAYARVLAATLFDQFREAGR